MTLIWQLVGIGAICLVLYGISMFAYKEGFRKGCAQGRRRGYADGMADGKRQKERGPW